MEEYLLFLIDFYSKKFEIWFKLQFEKAVTWIDAKPYKTQAALYTILYIVVSGILVATICGMMAYAKFLSAEMLEFLQILIKN